MRLETIRCSALPLAFRCPGSVLPVTVSIDSTDESAANGTATHVALEPVARGGAIPWDDLENIASRHGADPDTVKMLTACGAQLWEQVKASFPEAITEVALVQNVGELVITGHVDILSVTGTVARCGDWKTGFKDSEYREQMRGYCALVLLDSPELTEATCTLLWVRDREIENYTMMRAGLEEWKRELTESVVEWDGRYRPGRHCQHCPRHHECDASKALARSAVGAFVQQDVEALALLPASDIVNIYHQAKHVKALAERALNAIREHALDYGPIVANGTRVQASTHETTEVEPLEAWPILERFGFTDKDFAQCVKITTGAMKTVASARAGRGNGAKAVRKLMTDLDVAGALRHKQTSKLEERREK